MSVDITIPAEALEAGRKAFANAGTAEDHRDPFAEACLAMLKSWPGAYGNGKRKGWKHFTPAIILPFPQESGK